MEDSILRGFALKARKVLIEQITERAVSLGINKAPSDKSREPVSRFQIVKKTTPLDILYMDIEKRGFEQVIEDTACIWFNRITCIRYMEVNDFLPGRADFFDSGCIPDGKKETKNSMEDGKTDGEHGRRYIIKQCKKLAEIMPAMFKDNLGYEGLLLPDGVSKDKGIFRDIAKSIDQEYFIDNVQIIGWLYQYFISPKKERIYKGIKGNRKITKEDIPAATQFFTPSWIVKYMVENTLGRLWYRACGGDGLKARWFYYIEGENREPKAGEQDELCPEDIKFIDPAMGSGHILVYAFDVLYDIYLSLGYENKLIPGLIIDKNLYGLDIDAKVAAIAHFALMMKGRARDENFFNKGITPKLYPLQESNGLSIEDIMSFARENGNGQLSEGFIKDMKELLNVFHDAREFGSITVLTMMDLEPLQIWWESLCKGSVGDDDGSRMPYTGFEQMLRIIKQARVMLDTYHVVVTNPPYMGIRGMNPRLVDYLNTHYRHSKYDLFTVFMDLALKMTAKDGYFALINQHSWMFLSSYEKFREGFMEKCCIHSMLHLGVGVFGESVGTIVQSTAFVAKKAIEKDYYTVFIDLQPYGNSDEKEKALLARELGYGKAEKYIVRVSDFYNIPGKPMAYWAEQSITEAFTNNKKLKDVAKPRQGMATSNNKRFVRYWYEVPFQSIGFGCKDNNQALQSGYKWFPYNKGGPYRKWYGNNTMVVNWKRDGEELKKLASSLYGNYSRTIKNIKYYFKEAVTYTFISEDLGTRYSPPGFIFDVAGSSIFAPGEELYILLAFLCSKPSQMFLKLLNPTFNIQVGDMKNLPFPHIKNDVLREEIIKLSRENIKISKECWDSEEISWDFKKHPLLQFKKGAGTVEKAYLNWLHHRDTLIYNLRRNEERLNRIFIEFFNLEKCLTPEIEDRDITISKPDEKEAIKSFISYAVGCMFGRYSINREGIICPGGYPRGKARKDLPIEKKNNIIPVTEADCFKASILDMFIGFVERLFGRRTLAWNLDFIARCLDRKENETNIETLRRYFEKDFYRDHLLRYNRRPIYWLLDSGKEKGFRALVYLHRFNTMELMEVRKKYLKRIIGFYQKKLLSNSKNDSKACIKKRLNECIVYDKALLEVIRKGVSINPDESVACNYQKFQDILIKGEKNGQFLKMNLLAKRRS